MGINLDELEKLARAVPFPQWSARNADGRWLVLADDPDDDGPWHLCEMAKHIVDDEEGEIAAAFIAAANPAVVLELIERVRHAEQRAASAEDAYSRQRWPDTTGA